ncbi:UDP-N-acetylglucosaminyltransferase [Melampsora americana]|nr:UDP-N-acetylglucosaminyltransferase [Melampsora americana]
MRLSPPYAQHSLDPNQPSNLSHPAIPHILHQVFSPNSPVILAPSPVIHNSLHSHEYQPTYRSVDDWAMQVAQMAAPSIDRTATNYIASQLKHWAVYSQDTQLQQHVQEAKANAVIIAAKAQAVTFNSDEYFPDLTAYANTYKTQLEQIATGFYAKLHREALNQLNSHTLNLTVSSTTNHQTSQHQHYQHQYPHQHHQHPNRPQHQHQPRAQFNSRPSNLSSPPNSSEKTTQNVQAAAVAALTANVMAASELASRASQALSTLGMTIQTNLTSPLPAPGPTAIAATRQNLGIVSQPQQQFNTYSGPIPLNVPTDGPPIIPNSTTYSLNSSILPSTQRPINSLPHHIRHSRPPSSLENQPPPSQMLHDPSPPTAHLPHLPPSQKQDPSQSSNRPSPSTGPLTTQVEKLWRSAQDGECTERTRDYLLSYAHATYSKKPNDATVVLPLLHTLIKLHPNHLPSLLLLSCVYYSQGDYVSSLLYNNQILSIDPEYVEAMSNLGTTQRALGKWAEAEEWWWRAIRLRPTYFDAFDNLLGVLCNPQSHPTPTQPHSNGQQPQPRYTEALRLCTFVEGELFGTLPESARPLRLPSAIPPNHVHRVQNLFYAKGNLLIAAGKPLKARDEYEKAFEVAFGVPQTKPVVEAPDNALSTSAESSAGYGLVDVVLAMCSIGLLMMTVNANGAGSSQEPHVVKVLSDTGLWDPTEESIGIVMADPLRFARRRRQVIKDRLLKLGGGILPSVLLLPDNLEQLVRTVMSASKGILPVLKHHPLAHPSNGSDLSRNPALQSPNQTTSTVLLTLAKSLQDMMAAPMSPGAKLDGIPPSSSLLLPLYYLALTLHPSPSTCNNLGILLSTMPLTLTLQGNQPGRPPRVINGQQLAHTFYLQGLQRDRHHPHLYTNLGSLLKDMGQLTQAVSMYEKAVECNPNFDVALANLANAVKDMGRVQESVQWYLRAVNANPDFPEAVCGLVNALGGVCDWRDRGGAGKGLIVDGSGKLWLPTSEATDVVGKKPYFGLMGKVAKLVEKQLDEGMHYGKGVLRQTASLDQWLEVLASIKTGATNGFSSVELAHWRSKLEPFFINPDECRPQPTGSASNRFNEGGFIIRLVERCARQAQRRWYLDLYGQMVETDSADQAEPEISKAKVTGSSYQRLAVPSSLGLPPVPTVLPFHTFTYPLDARECRLISHRNALRISLGTLSQPWIGTSVYPPPPPPVLGKIRVGYVSSDFNNHPLAHLMQSVFGLHDRNSFEVVCYGTTASDGSTYRKKIERDVGKSGFVDVSGWETERIVRRIVDDKIHILINLNGYTKGARNEIFAARPCPVQMEFMGFAGTLASGWTDWIIADPIVCPPRMVSGEKWRRRHDIARGEGEKISEIVEDLATDFDGDLDPECADEDWVYTEKFLYMPHSYFVCDHKQGFRDETAESVDIDGIPAPVERVDPRTSRSTEEVWAEEEVRRWKMRREMFPDLSDDTVIFANFNQLYKVDPVIFKYWLEILASVPNSILWLLRFPAPGEPHLKLTAEKWAGMEVASRIRFTDVAPKALHIQRGRIADLFLDSTECNAHTTAADILWSGTPILTLPRETHVHKMCSRVAASIALATGFGTQMIATDLNNYKDRAIHLAKSLNYQQITLMVGPEQGPRQALTYLTAGIGELALLRRSLFETRDRSALFDTSRWVANLEKGLRAAWERFVNGTDCEEGSEWREWKDLDKKKTCSIWIKEEVEDGRASDLGASHQRTKFIKMEDDRAKSGSGLS